LVGADLDPGDAPVPLVRGDVYRLPFPDGSFDAIFICAVLQQLADPLRTRGTGGGGPGCVVEAEFQASFFDAPAVIELVRQSGLASPDEMAAIAAAATAGSMLAVSTRTS